MPPPVWLLDVDGVINTRRPLWGPELRRGTAWSEGEDFPMRWAPGLITRMDRFDLGGRALTIIGSPTHHAAGSLFTTPGRASC